MRVQTVYQLLADALTNEEIIRFAAENWDVGRRQTENYIAEARELQSQDCAISRQAYLAEVLHRLRKIEQAATKRAQYQVATNAIRLQTDLVGLTGKTA